MINVQSVNFSSKNEARKKLFLVNFNKVNEQVYPKKRRQIFFVNYYYLFLHFHCYRSAADGLAFKGSVVT